MSCSDLALFALQLLVYGALIGASAYYLVVLYSAREFFARGTEATSAPDELPGITVLKPLKGVDVGLYENLASLCHQDYPRVQIVCGVSDPGDPAVAVVRRLQEAYPHVAVDLVIDGRTYGTNSKVSNLHNMMGQVRHDVVVIADSDIRVAPGYLRELATALADPAVGIVTCLYRAVAADGMPTRIESLFINTDFSAMVMAARKVERPMYAFGATIAMRRHVLDEIGGFLPLADFLADDYQLGYRVAARGYRLVLARYIVDTMIRLDGWRHLLRHQVRWARTYRVCRPGGFFGSIVTHGTFWACAHLLLNGTASAGALWAVPVLTLRLLVAYQVGVRGMKARADLLDLALLLPKDLFISLVWFLAFAGNEVVWSGRRFRVAASGEMAEVCVPRWRWRAQPAAVAEQETTPPPLS